MNAFVGYIKREPLRAFGALELAVGALAAAAGLSAQMVAGLMGALGVFLGIPKVGVRQLVTPVASSNAGPAPATAPAPQKVAMVPAAPAAG